jgi:hypothetical protein
MFNASSAAQNRRAREGLVYDLGRFSIDDSMNFMDELKDLTKHEKTLEGAAGKLTRFFFDNLVDGPGGHSALVLARLYKTHTYGSLTPGLRTFADNLLGSAKPAPDLRCLTLMASSGIKAEWEHRQSSSGHKAIPLTSEKFVEQAPMISQLLKQFGMDVPAVLRPDPALIMDMSRKEYNVFHVATALGSPFIPAQKEFVVPYGVKSVVGFGGMLLSGEVVAMILFSRVPIFAEVARLFKPLGPRVTSLALPFIQNRTVFEGS